MQTPFPPFAGPPPFPPPGGFGPFAHHAAHRRRVREHIREHARGHRHGPRYGPFPPGIGFDPRAFGFDPRAFGFGPGGHPGRRGGRGRRRGDVRAAILALLLDRPMHGYEMIQEIAERTQDLWRPSPGSVYPTLQLLEDEGLIRATESDGSKRLFELTDDGRAAAEQIATPPWAEITEEAEDAAAGQVPLRNAVGQLMAAIAQAAFATTAEQQERIVGIINTARREIYQVLGESL